MSFSSDIKKTLSEAELKKDCCRESFARGGAGGPFEPRCEKDTGAYLRGAFIKYGFVSAPGRDFMLSFSPRGKEHEELLVSVLEKAGFAPKRAVRKGKPLIYFKKSEDIEDILSLCGAVKAALDIISSKVMSDVRNNANRVTNAETANLDRMARAAAEQTGAINIIVARGALCNLPFELRECAELRLANPDMSLSELRALMREPVSKSGLNHRFRRIMEIAEEL
ncbi:MAG: DNA-binding protein WhiA [Clostridia bacterium]|nr:DNA-binding protein WhiA [Clostridia bacterium]